MPIQSHNSKPTHTLSSPQITRQARSQRCKKINVVGRKCNSLASLRPLGSRAGQRRARQQGMENSQAGVRSFVSPAGGFSTDPLISGFASRITPAGAAGHRIRSRRAERHESRAPAVESAPAIRAKKPISEHQTRLFPFPATLPYHRRLAPARNNH